MIEIFANLATTTLAGPISAGALSVNLAAGTGTAFPNPSPGASYFMLTFQDAATSGVHEIVQVTARTADTCTIVRAQEGTAASAWLAGDLADNRWTAGSAATMVQVAQLQQQAGNYGVDTGSANAYAVTLNPVPSSLSFLTGVPIRVKIATANTGASTLTVNGLASTVIKNPNGTGLLSGQLVAGGIAIFMFDGTQFELQATTYPGRLLGPPQQFITSGTYVPTPGMAAVIFEVQGGGAAGAGAGGAAAGNVSLGAPGTSGAYAKGMFTAAQVGASQSVVVGAGGTPVSNGVGGNGGTSSVGALISAPGGVGGGLLNNQVPPTANGNGTVTSAPTGGNIVPAFGGPGYPSLALSVTLGLGGQGGASPFGPGGSAPQINNIGVAGVNTGTGGSGCVLNTAGGSTAGGAGFRGVVIAWEYS